MTDSPIKPAISPLVFIFATVFIDLAGVGILNPVLPFLVERFRTDASVLGYLISSFAVAQLLAAPVLGTLSDRFGRRPVLLVCMLGTALSYFLFGAAPTLWVMFASRVLGGATGGVITTAQAYIADVSSPEHRTRNFGLVGTALGLGFIFGPALGGALAKIQLNLPVYVAGVLALLNAVLGYFTLPESLSAETIRLNRERPVQSSELNPFVQVARLLRDERVRRLVWGFLLFNFAFAGFTSIFALYLKNRFGWGPAQAAGLFTCVGVVLTIVQGGLIRRLVPMYGERKLILYGLLMAGLSFALIPLAPSGPWLYATQTLLAAGVGVALPSMRGLISNRVSGREQGRIIGGTQGLTSLAQILGPLFAAWSIDHLGLSSPFWIGVAITMVSLSVLSQAGAEPSSAVS